MLFKSITALLFAVSLAGCAVLKPAASGSGESAVVTGVANGSANIPAERMYVLRTSSGRMVTTTQALRQVLKEGDKVDIERGSNGRVIILEK
jgi:hypothetical protein